MTQFFLHEISLKLVKMLFTVVGAIQCWAVLEGDKNCQLDSGVIMNIL